MEKFFFALFLFLYYTGLYTQFNGSGSGTSTDPHLITNRDELNQIRNYLNNPNVYFKFINDTGGLIGNNTGVALNTYVVTITASVNPESGGTILGDGNYNSGEMVSLSVTPNMGYHFVSWTENGMLCGLNTLMYFKAVGDRTLVANLELDYYPINISASPEDGGTISCGGTSPCYGGLLNYGTNLLLTATPNTGYAFVNWTEDGTLVSTDSNYNFTVISPRTLIANFMLLTAVENQTTQTLDIYPNPAHDYINICSTDGASLRVEILDFSGKILLKATDKTTIDVSNLKHGIYIVNINGKLFKLVKDQ